MIKHLFIATFLFLSSNAFAMFCPANFNQINIGDSIDAVVKVCGQPNSQNSYKKTTNLSEEWVYYVKTSFNNNATSKMTVIFANNKVVNISIESTDSTKSNSYQVGNQQFGTPPIVNIAFNNQAPVNVASTTACGLVISIGNSPQQVESSCGRPVLIKQNQSPNSQNSPQMTEFKYSSIPPVTLIFENGILKERIMS